MSPAGPSGSLRDPCVHVAGPSKRLPRQSGRSRAASVRLRGWNEAVGCDGKPTPSRERRGGMAGNPSADGNPVHPKVVGLPKHVVAGSMLGARTSPAAPPCSRLAAPVRSPSPAPMSPTTSGCTDGNPPARCSIDTPPAQPHGSFARGRRCVPLRPTPAGVACGDGPSIPCNLPDPIRHGFMASLVGTRVCGIRGRGDNTQTRKESVACHE